MTTRPEFFMFFGSRMLGWQSGACVHRLGAYTAALLAKERHKFMVAFGIYASILHNAPKQYKRRPK